MYQLVKRYNLFATLIRDQISGNELHTFAVTQTTTRPRYMNKTLCRRVNFWPKWSLNLDKRLLPKTFNSYFVTTRKLVISINKIWNPSWKPILWRLLRDCWEITPIVSRTTVMSYWIWKYWWDMNDHPNTNDVLSNQVIPELQWLEQKESNFVF